MEQQPVNIGQVNDPNIRSISAVEFKEMLDRVIPIRPISKFIYLTSDNHSGSLVLNISYVASHIIDIEYDHEHTCERHRTPVPAAHISTSQGQRWTFEGAAEVIRLLEELVKEREELAEAVGWMLQEARATEVPKS